MNSLIIHKFYFVHYPNTPGPGHYIEYKNGIFEYRTTPEGFGHAVAQDFVLKLGMHPDEIMPIKSSISENLKIDPDKVERFYQYISRYCKHWKKNYSQNIICDGADWECKIHINDFKLYSKGNIYCPKNFESFLYKLQVMTGGKIFG